MEAIFSTAGIFQPQNKATYMHYPSKTDKTNLNTVATIYLRLNILYKALTGILTCWSEFGRKKRKKWYGRLRLYRLTTGAHAVHPAGV